VKTESWNIRSHSDMQTALAQIGQAQIPCTLTLNTGEEKRRDRQNRFAFEAYKQIAQILADRSVDDVRAECKLHCGVPMLRVENDAFREKYDQHVRGLPYETKLAIMVEPFDFPVTRLMSVKQMARYITAMLAHFDAQGASVMLPDYDL